MTVKPGSKYFPLLAHLRRSQAHELTLGFAEIEALLDEPLPPSAYSKRAFWSNRRRGGHQSAAWLEAGYRVAEADLKGRRVTFTPARVRYNVQRARGEVRWTGNMIRALRQHLQASQEEMAEMLGVRQQTVSEWETEAYAPTRARSKHLTLVAESSEFPFEA